VACSAFWFSIKGVHEAQTLFHFLFIYFGFFGSKFMFFSLLPALSSQFVLFQQGSSITQGYSFSLSIPCFISFICCINVFSVSLQDLTTCVHTFCSLVQQSISTQKSFIGIVMAIELESLAILLGLEVFK
jgi:hypothetical protein